MKPESFTIMHCINRARERYGINDFTEADWHAMNRLIRSKSECATPIKKSRNGSYIWQVRYRDQLILVAYMKKRGVLSLLPKDDGRLAAYERNQVRQNAQHVSNCYRDKLASLNKRIAKAEENLEQLLRDNRIAQARQQIAALTLNRENLLAEIAAFEDINSGLFKPDQ